MLRVRSEALSLFFFTILALIATAHSTTQTMSSLARNDPYPMFTSQDPQTFNHTNDKLLLLELIDKKDYWKQHVTISLSPFGQNADIGRGLCGERFIGGEPVELGDIAGRWSMIPLLFGSTPANQTLPSILQNAQDTLFPVSQFPRPVSYDPAVDHEQKFAYFSIPLKYRKRGLRVDIDAQIIGDFGLTVQTGVADIAQCLKLSNTLNTPAGFIDLTQKSSNLMPTGDSTNILDKTFGCTDITVRDVECLLMDQIDAIADQLELNICDFSQISIEDIRLQLYWRHAYELTPCAQDTVGVLAIPYFQLGGSLATAKKTIPSTMFALPFGNNDHNAIGFTGGVNFDFAQTVEFGAEIGVTHFFGRDFCKVPVPTNQYQSGLYPFKTDIHVNPGLNWHFAGKLAAYHFLECLSCWFEYVMMEHQQDSICLKQADPAFKPEILEKKTPFQAKFFNTAFNYDLSPHVAIGFLWQAPLAQKNSYRSTTVLLSITGSF